MKKVHFTNAQLNAVSDKIVRVGYCGCQYLLHGLDAFAYNKGVYGWNWDAFDIGGVVVCTGYRNLTGETVQYSDLEERAQKIVLEGFRNSWEWQKMELEKLRAELVERCSK